MLPPDGKLLEGKITSPRVGGNGSRYFSEPTLEIWHHGSVVAINKQQKPLDQTVVPFDYLAVSWWPTSIVVICRAANRISCTAIRLTQSYSILDWPLRKNPSVITTVMYMGGLGSSPIFLAHRQVQQTPLLMALIPIRPALYSKLPGLRPRLSSIPSHDQ